ncbi:hypothetical protein Patl1_13473 [Pistacia atlantica]|uniref:Uncharacterized protein n=1 Tax=Pistacia atlantica TaxID=434234 RepID=A0ACC1ATS0_9ROSI|nr:hypothetical protein Patl1_13473 [Pistacia atlantica]
MDQQQAPKKRGRKPKPKEDKKDEQQQTPKMKDTAKRTQYHSVDDKYTQWKSLVPVLYDWLANHNLVWPSLSCRWGPQLEQATYKNRQRLYLSEQTDGSVPNTLVIANCEVVKPRVAAAEHISQFNEEARSPFVKKYKTIIHPGEVNRIRELPQNTKIVATHTDSPDVLIWDVEAQPNRHAVLGATNSRPDLILTGHQDNAEFALAMCPTEPYVLSGGKDKSVVLWSIQDHITTSTTDPATAKSAGSGGSIIKPNPKPGEGNDKAGDGPSIGPRGIYCGHEDTVEDVTFCPSSAQEFCSVGDDSCLILWDARVGSNPVIKVMLTIFISLVFSVIACYMGCKVLCMRFLILESMCLKNVLFDITSNSDDDLCFLFPFCCFTGRLRKHIMLIFTVLIGIPTMIILYLPGDDESPWTFCWYDVSRSADNSVRMFDRRNLTSNGVGSPIHKFEGHRAAVLCVQWSPDKSSVFGSSAEDGLLNIWDYEKVESMVLKALSYTSWRSVSYPLPLESCFFDLFCFWLSDFWLAYIIFSCFLRLTCVCVYIYIYIYCRLVKRWSMGQGLLVLPQACFSSMLGTGLDKVVDFHWNASDPWTVVSVSDDCDTTGGGGTLQIWRMSDLIYRPEEEVLAELEKFKSHVISCGSKS